MLAFAKGRTIYVRRTDVSIIFFKFLSVLGICKRRLYSWVCGVGSRKVKVISKAEQAAVRARMTSITETSTERMALNVAALFLLLSITFLFGYFAQISDHIYVQATVVFCLITLCCTHQGKICKKKKKMFRILFCLCICVPRDAGIAQNHTLYNVTFFYFSLLPSFPTLKVSTMRSGFDHQHCHVRQFVVTKPGSWLFPGYSVSLH